MHPEHSVRRRVAIMGSYPPSLLNFRGPLLRRLVDYGHEVVALAPNAPGISQQLSAVGVEFIPVNVDRTGMDPRRDLAMQRDVTSILRDCGTDVFLAYTIKPVVWGIPAARRAGVPTRVALVTGIGHVLAGMPRWHPLAIASRVLYRRALAQATRTVFQNPDNREEFVAGGLVESERTSVVAGSGVDLGHYRRATTPPHPPVNFLLIARLLAPKGIREFAAAARIVRTQIAGCEFHLVGPTDPNPSGLAISEVQEWVDEGLIHYHGAADDVRPHLAACHVYVLPSYYGEGTPRSVLEALAVGRPVITTDVAGCRETVVDGLNGFLAPPRDPSAIADAMIRLASDAEMRSAMAAESRKIAEERFDAELVVDQMLDAMEIAR